LTVTERTDDAVGRCSSFIVHRFLFLFRLHFVTVRWVVRHSSNRKKDGVSRPEYSLQSVLDPRPNDFIAGSIISHLGESPKSG